MEGHWAEKMDLDLLYVSKQISLEASGIFYSKNLFSFANVHCFNGFINKYQANTGCIRRLMLASTVSNRQELDKFRRIISSAASHLQQVDRLILGLSYRPGYLDYTEEHHNFMVNTGGPALYQSLKTKNLKNVFIHVDIPGVTNEQMHLVAKAMLINLKGDENSVASGQDGYIHSYTDREQALLQIQTVNEEWRKAEETRRVRRRMEERRMRAAMIDARRIPALLTHYPIATQAIPDNSQIMPTDGTSVNRSCQPSSMGIQTLNVSMQPFSEHTQYSNGNMEPFDEVMQQVNGVVQPFGEDLQLYDENHFRLFEEDMPTFDGDMQCFNDTLQPLYEDPQPFNGDLNSQPLSMINYGQPFHVNRINQPLNTNLNS
jgi:hypothetical protein